jgi:hypothetical protein
MQRSSMELNFSTQISSVCNNVAPVKRSAKSFFKRMVALGHILRKWFSEMACGASGEYIGPPASGPNRSQTQRYCQGAKRITRQYGRQGYIGWYYVIVIHRDALTRSPSMIIEYKSSSTTCQMYSLCTVEKGRSRSFGRVCQKCV